MDGRKKGVLAGVGAGVGTLAIIGRLVSHCGDDGARVAMRGAGGLGDNAAVGFGDDFVAGGARFGAGAGDDLALEGGRYGQGLVLGSGGDDLGRYGLTPVEGTAGRAGTQLDALRVASWSEVAAAGEGTAASGADDVARLAGGGADDVTRSGARSGLGSSRVSGDVAEAIGEGAADVALEAPSFVEGGVEFADEEPWDPAAEPIAGARIGAILPSGDLGRIDMISAGGGLFDRPAALARVLEDRPAPLVLMVRPGSEGTFISPDGIAVPFEEVLDLCDEASSACVFLVCHVNTAISSAHAHASSALEGVATVGEFVAALRARIDGERIDLVARFDPR